MSDPDFDSVMNGGDDPPVTSKMTSYAERSRVKMRREKEELVRKAKNTISEGKINWKHMYRKFLSVLFDNSIGVQLEKNRLP